MKIYLINKSRIYNIYYIMYNIILYNILHNILYIISKKYIYNILYVFLLFSLCFSLYKCIIIF